MAGAPPSWEARRPPSHGTRGRSNGRPRSRASTSSVAGPPTPRGTSSRCPRPGTWGDTRTTRCIGCPSPSPRRRRAPSLHAVLVALGVLHDDPVLLAPLVWPDTGGARRDQPFDLRVHPRSPLPQRDRAPPAHVQVQVHAVLDRLRLGHPLEEDAGADAGRVLDRARGVPFLLGDAALTQPPLPGGEPLGGSRNAVPEGRRPEPRQTIGVRAIERDLERCRHRSLL